MVDNSIDSSCMEELVRMIYDEKICRIEEELEKLLTHLILEDVEDRTTRKRDLMILQSIYRINRLNRKRRTNGCYLSVEEIQEAVESAWPLAMGEAALLAHENLYSNQDIEKRVDKNEITRHVLRMIVESAPLSSPDGMDENQNITD